MRSAAPRAYRMYAVLVPFLAPLLWARQSRRLAAQDIAPDRRRERLGYASLPRPDGRLLWFHAASVGESLSVLALIEALARRAHDLHFLITSGTASSARLLSQRMPARCRHQFAPLDTSAALRRFHDHWRPDLGLFVESELWPQMIVHSARRGIPVVLLNARLSSRSMRNWGRFPETARFLLRQFALILTQGQGVADRLVALGADPASTRPGDDLKAAAAAAPLDAQARDRMRRAIAGRPLWLASSTHPGEDEIVLDAHARLRAQHPGLLLILVPRHPERGDDLQRMIAQAGLAGARRAHDQPLTPRTDVYLADTLGETALWYALSEIVFLGGSLVPVGGHNPYEAASAGAALLHGPLVANAAQTYADYDESGGSLCTPDAAAIVAAVDTLLRDPARRAGMQAASRAFAQASRPGLDATVDSLLALLPPAPGPERTA